MGEPLIPSYNPPPLYTGELFGVEYLYHQTGLQFSSTDEEVDREIDEGFGDLEDEVEQLQNIDPTAYSPESSNEEEDNETVSIHTNNSMW